MTLRRQVSEEAENHFRLQDWGGMIPDEQFNAKTDALAAQIAESFPGRRLPIGLWGGNSVDYLAALFAVLRSGNTVVPLNTRLAPRELADIAETANISGLLAARDFPPSHREAVAQIPAFTYPISGAPKKKYKLAELDDRDIAALICSSGSTGKPKIVPLTLRSMFDHARAMCDHLKVTWHDSWIMCLPAFHVGGLAIPFRCLVSRASLLISQSADPEELNHLIDVEGATLISVVPTVLERMLSVREGKPFPKTLRAIIVGGGPVSERLLARCPVAFATYGLTEAGSTVTCARPGCGDEERKTAGLPLPGTKLRIVDDDGADVKVGDSGEIIFRGPGMARGYLGDTESNAQAFRKGWVFTGDRGQLTQDGCLIVEGRGDMLISGGENIQPAEIEQALLQHPRITAAVVLAVESKEWGQTPAAFIVVSPGRPLQKIHIFQFLEDKLARYKFPKKVVIAEELPMLSNGKPDLKAIRAALREIQ